MAHSGGHGGVLDGRWLMEHPHNTTAPVYQPSYTALVATSNTPTGHWLFVWQGCNRHSCMRAWGVLLLALGSPVLMSSGLGRAAAPAHHHRHGESITFNSSLGLTYKPPIVFPALQTHTASVLCLHGLARLHKGLLCCMIDTVCACIAYFIRSRLPLQRSLPAIVPKG